MSDVVVTILADSSLAVAKHWNTIIGIYINSLLLRLFEGRSSESFFISIVTYSSADHRPTPIISRRYFNDPKSLSKEMKEEPAKLGIGRTGSGGKMGMAALEGYAATLEMFDLFLSTHRTSKEVTSDKPSTDSQVAPLCHIIHISACNPDESRHPVWNQTSALDSLNWKTLPDELRKRNINLNLLLLNPNKLLSELHSTMNTESQSVFFNTFPDHTWLLASPASWASLSAKRVSENGETDNGGDAKRARVSTPKQNHAAPTSQISQPAKPAENKTVPPSTAQQNPTQPSLPNPIVPTLHMALKKYKEMEANYRQSEAQVEQLRQQGRLQEYEALKNTMGMKSQQLYRLKQYIITLQQRTAAAAAASSGSGKQAEGSGGQGIQPVPGPSSSAPAPNTQVPTGQQLQQFVQAQRQAQLIPGANSAPDGRPPPNMLPQFSPSVAAQMQKLQMKEGIQGQVSMSSAPVQQPQQSQQPALMSQSTQNVSNPPQSQQTNPNLWNGTIAWKAPPSMNQMEARVLVRSTVPIRPELWPPRLEIEFLREQAVPLQTLKPWISLHKPAVCQLRPIPIPNNQENELRFKSLSTFLVERNVNGIASWLVNNNMKPRLLLFPMGGDGTQLAAAVFPETGIPELPRVNPSAPPQPAPRPQFQPFSGVQNQSQLAALMQTMTPEQRAAMIAYLRQQRQPMQQVPQAQQNANPPNVNPIVNNNLNPGNPFMLANLPGGGWPAGVPPGGVMGQNPPTNMQGGMNIVQALAALQQQQQQQRQNGMSGPPGSGGPPPF